MDVPSESPNPLSLLLELGQAFHSTLDYDPLLVSILQHTQRAAQSEGASIWLLDQAHTWLECTHAVGPEAEELIITRLPAEILWADGPLSAGVTIRIDDVSSDPAAARCLNAPLRARAHSAVIAPLVARGERLGVITVTNRIGAAYFSNEDRGLIAAIAGHAAVALQNAQLFERQRRGAERQALLKQISRHLQSTLDIDALIPLVLHEVNKALQAEAQSLWMLNRATGMLECRFATGPEASAIKNVQVPVGRGLVGTSVAARQPIIIPDAQRDPRTFRAADEHTGYVTRTLICVPLVVHGEAVGAIEAINKRDGLMFGPDDLDLLRSIAYSAGLAIENARLFAELSASYDSTLEALAAALDLRDRETEGHSRRVVAYTGRLAQALGLDGAEISTICRGALIHDIGKIGVPDAVLLKPSALSSEERRIIERHPREGYKMLEDIAYLSDEVEIVLAHQERWDGSGYPQGLRGEAIPLGARLFAVADTFDALTSDRPYRPARSMAAAREIIAAESGRQFDPRTVAAFLSVALDDWARLCAQVEGEIMARREHRDRSGNGRKSGLG